MTAAQNPLTLAPFTMDVASRNLPTPRSALAIGAHPDDIDFGCGATIAKWAAEGCTVHVLVCTDGSKGTWDPSTETAELVSTRQREQRAAAKILGATGEVVFLGSVDGELASGLPERRTVARWIRALQPQVVLGHDPWKRYRLHPDHRHAGLLACEGVVGARDPLFFPELLESGLAPHRPDVILLWEADEPDHLEEVDGFAGVKADALLAHQSQFTSTMASAGDPEMRDFVVRVEAKLAEAATAAGDHTQAATAEAFKLIDDL